MGVDGSRCEVGALREVRKGKRCRFGGLGSAAKRRIYCSVASGGASRGAPFSVSKGGIRRQRALVVDLTFEAAKGRKV